MSFRCVAPPSTPCLLISSLCFFACASNPSAGSRYAEVQVKSVEGPPAELAHKAAPNRTCDVRLYIEQEPGHGVYSLASGQLGVAAVSVLGGTAVDGICIKEPGKALALPAPIQLASPEGKDLGRFCDGAITPAKAGTVDVQTCDWNGSFHASRPFSFVLVTDQAERVADYVDFVRVYRNGDLMAAWNSAVRQSSPHVVTIEGEPLRSKWLSVSLPPHDSPLDLRIIPHDNAATRAVDLMVRNDALLFQKKLLGAAKAGALAAFPPDSPIGKSFACLETTIQHVRAQVLHVVNAEIPSQQPPKCSLDLQLAYGSPLSQKYVDIKNQSEAAAASAKQQAQATLDQAKVAIEAKLPPVLAKQLEGMMAELAKSFSQKVQQAVSNQVGKHSDVASYLRALRGSAPEGEKDYETFLRGAENLVKALDDELTLALASVDEARALALELHSELKSIAQDPNRQAQIFNVFATSLGNEGDTFEERRANPPLDAGEQKVPMRYRDPFQFYALAPWNGIPIRTGTESGADLNAAVAIPLVDVVGGRFQFGPTRFSEIRVGLGIGYTTTEEVSENGEKRTRAAALPNISIGAANLKIGFGYVTTDSQKTDQFKDHVRWIVGADLFKLISGKNVEVL